MPGPTGGAYSAPPDPLAGLWEGRGKWDGRAGGRERGGESENPDYDPGCSKVSILRVYKVYFTIEAIGVANAQNSGVFVDYSRAAVTSSAP